MSEILYRAKRMDNGELVYGLPSYNCVDGRITEIETRDCGFIEVDPETICQYTGVPDKNGRKIFEGDICRREILGGIIIGQVVWIEYGMCGFKLKHGNDYYPIGKFEHTGRNGDEVIGKIFDNPELLESEVQMKYSIEIKNSTVTEQLEYKGRIYQKEWDVEYGGMRLKDKEFHEQLEDSGITDEGALEEVYSVIDELFAARFLGVFKALEGAWE